MGNKDQQYTVEPLDYNDCDTRVGLKRLGWEFQANTDGTITFELPQGFFIAGDWADQVEFYDKLGQLVAHLVKPTRTVRFF